MSDGAVDSQLGLFDAVPPGPVVRVRRSARARKLSLRVYPHGRVEVVVPRRTGPGQVRRFVEAHQPWIRETLAAMGSSDPATSVALPDEIRLRLTGEAWRVHIARAPDGRARLQESATGSLNLVVPEDDLSARRLLRRWLLARARAELLPWLEVISGRTGLRYAGASVGRQRTRWGSCSSEKHIRLNCGLLFLPRRLVHYLMVHELCHIRHMNHSPRFWRLVESLVPDAKEAERALSAAWRRVPGWVHYDD